MAKYGSSIKFMEKLDMRSIIFIVLVVKASYLFAVVPVVIPLEETREIIAVTTYLRQIHDLINGIADTNDIARQLASLHSLIELQNKVDLVCGNICD